MTTKTKSLLTNLIPIMGVPDGKGSTDPSIREAWLEQRRGGLTATEVRDWGVPMKRRKIIESKVVGGGEDLNHIPAVRHGNLREPVIAEWVHAKFGIAPCDNVYAHPENPRHLASPDGITLDPFTGELIVGSEDAVVAEIKTSKHDLTPGPVDSAGYLIEIEQGSHFDRSGYYVQMNWQMYVMNATRTLFVYEQHDGTVDPETDTFRPSGPPQWAWIPRDEKLIQRLVNDLAPTALETIDTARAAAAGGMPPVSDADPAVAALTAELFKARDAEAIAKASKEKAWKALQEIYLAKAEGAEHPEDVSLDLGFGRITVNTVTKSVPKLNMEAARNRAPKLVAQYEALIKRYTKPVEETKTSFTVTPTKAEK